MPIGVKPMGLYSYCFVFVKEKPIYIYKVVFTMTLPKKLRRKLQLMSLYIGVRAFSYAKKKVGLHKIQTNTSKSHSIRIEMKKSYMDRN